jgi:hypothetical protein
MKLNTNIDLEVFKNYIYQLQPVYRVNYRLMVIESNFYTHGHDVKYEQTKKKISNRPLDKMIILSNYSCDPYLHNLTGEDYLVFEKQIFLRIFISSWWFIPFFFWMGINSLCNKIFEG